MTKQKSPLISPEEVMDRMADPSVVIVDARVGPGAQERYMSGHIRGAVHIDLETELSAKAADPAHGGRHPLPDPKNFGALLGKNGVTPSTHVIVYDDKGGANAAARFWWMMRAVEHDNIQVVDGGLQGMEAAGVPLEKDVATFIAAQGNYPVGEWTLPLADIAATERARLNQDCLVIDVREGYRYRGESEPIDLVAGHIPGAVNIPFLTNLGEDGRFRSSESLANFYQLQLGHREPKNIIVHCGSGVTACHTILAMDAAGLKLPRLYVGSWSEWSRRNKPIATGEQP